MKAADTGAAPAEASGAPPAASARRLWQLAVECHGPLVGCCWTTVGLRQLTDRLFGGRSSLIDFELHVAVAEQCASQNKVSLALQRDLERRFRAQRLHFAAAADTGALRRLWSQALAAGDAAAALWATLSHAQCDEALRVVALQDLYLLQNERVALQAQDLAARQSLLARLATLKADALRAEQRQARWRSDALAEREALQAQLAELRGRLQAQAAQIARLGEQATAAEPSAAGRPTQRRCEGDDALAQQHPDPTPARMRSSLTLTARALPLSPTVAHLPSRRPLQDPSREPAQEPSQEPSRKPSHMASPPAILESAPPAAVRRQRPPSTPPPGLAADALRATSVLCVGGRHGHVPQYRELVERHGGRFAHHDGGIEDNVQRLDAQLAAADVVLCQSGCLNHNAYARVKAHCKRSGKPCVYLDKPGMGSFLRGLAQVPAASPS